MLVYVYRSGLGDCTNGGVSAHAEQLFVTNVFEEGKGYKAPAGVPRVKLVKRPYGNVVLVPEGEEGWTMFGGNYAACSDSRWNEAVEKLSGYEFGFPVAIHDRVER